jgi:hypothetical protein
MCNKTTRIRARTGQPLASLQATTTKTPHEILHGSHGKSRAKARDLERGRAMEGEELTLADAGGGVAAGGAGALLEVEAAAAAADAERVRLVPALAEAARALRLQKQETPRRVSEVRRRSRRRGRRRRRRLGFAGGDVPSLKAGEATKNGWSGGPAENPK